MSQAAEVRDLSGPPAGAQGFVFRICTSNPFYVISAGLFLAGLRISFGAQTRDIDTWALMFGLAGYTLLLAVTACLLVRFGNVWDDVRTVLLLVVLMFLATSVTFDEVLVMDPSRGQVCYLGGLLLAVVVSEGLLRGTRLRLPACFRTPYYLILALFFLYPLALGPLTSEPYSETLWWALFGFSATAGLVFLTLLPAIRRGPDYVADNGSPWRWPLYPWVLFGMVAAAVPARSFLLCWSMHLLENGDRDQIIFGPYFVVPFGFAVALLLLEIGLVPLQRAGVLGTALALPAGLVVLALVGHRGNSIYLDFRHAFTERLGGDPLYLTLAASAVFYGYAGLRRVSLAWEWLTATLAALAVVGPHALELGISAPHPWPILLAATLQLALGLWQRESWRTLLGGVGVAAVALLALPHTGDGLRAPIAFHLMLLVVMLVGAAFDDALARMLRMVSAGFVLCICLAQMAGTVDVAGDIPDWLLVVYPLVMAGILAAYGWLLGHRPAQVLAGFVVVAWLLRVGWRGYWALRILVAGLDYLAVSLLLFMLAVAISVLKSRLLARQLALPDSEPTESTS